LIFSNDIREKLKIDFKNNFEIAIEILAEKVNEHECLQTDRILRCIIYLSKGDIHKLKKNIEIAIIDPRDIIYQAEYLVTDEDDFNGKRLRNFNRPFDQALLKQTKSIFQTNKKTTRTKTIKYFILIFTLGFASYFISPILKPYKNYTEPFHFIFTIVLITAICIYFALEQTNKMLTFNYSTEKLEYSYSTFLKKNNLKSFDFGNINYRLEPKATRNGKQIELVILSNIKPVCTINNKHDEFTDIENVCREIDEIKKDCS